MGESQSLLRVCGICLFLRLTMLSIYDPKEEHNIDTSRILFNTHETMAPSGG